MKIRYRQHDRVTLVSMCEGKLVGVSSCRPDDNYRNDLGLAVALVKASKRLPPNEMHFLDELNVSAFWKNIIINEKAFGMIVQHMLGYRIAIGPILALPIETIGLSISPIPIFHDTYAYEANVKMRAPACVVAERIGRDLLAAVPKLSARTLDN